MLNPSAYYKGGREKEPAFVRRSMWMTPKFASKSKRKHRDLNSNFFNTWDEYNSQIANQKKIRLLCDFWITSTLYSAFSNDNL
jgi:hypothetical protein